MATCAFAPTAHAQLTDRQMQAVEAQIQALKAELKRVKEQNAARDRALRAAREAPPTPPAIQPAPVIPQIPSGYALMPAAPGTPGGAYVLTRVEPPKPEKQGVFHVGNISIQLGGYLTGDAVFRSRNAVNDIQSNYTTGIPLAINPTYHEAQTILSARTSRLTATLGAAPDEVTKLRAYLSVDFQGGAPTANYNESSSWNPRIREGWLAYDRSDWGFEALAGQAWSLLTMNKTGTDPLTTNTPITIDPNYVPGFSYARQATFRVVKTFNGGQYQVAAALENPATTYGGTLPTIPGSTINITNPGIGINANGVNYSNNFAPDLTGKMTADFDLAHFEVYGLGRVFNDRVSQIGTGQNNSTIGGGGGAAALIHVIPKVLDVQVSGMAGRGISRYDPSQLPDSTIGADGKPSVLPGWEALAGVVAHPIPALDVFGYVGTDNVSARYSSITTKGKTAYYGYGNPNYDNSGCDTEGAAATTCVGNTSGVAQATVGGWYRLLHGSYGTVQVGTQYAYTRRFIFQGLGTTPRTDSHMVFLSFRYFPFQ
jgi:hypothetical protein